VYKPQNQVFKLTEILGIFSLAGDFELSKRELIQKYRRV